MGARQRGTGLASGAGAALRDGARTCGSVCRAVSALLLAAPALAWAAPPNLHTETLADFRNSPLPASRSAAIPELHLTTEHSPPASMLVEGRVGGRETDKLREMLERGDIPHRFDLLPWKRAYTLALHAPFTCVYSTARTPEREALFKWVGPTDVSEWVLMCRADARLRLRSLDDARGLRIGTYNGDAREEYLQARGLRVEPVGNDALNPQKLLLKRIDLWAVGQRRGSQLLAQQKLTGKIVPLLVFHRVKVYLACNPSVSDSLIERMNANLDEMRHDGSFQRLDRKYEKWTRSDQALY